MSKTVTFHHSVTPLTSHLISSTTYTPNLDISPQISTNSIRAVIHSGASHTMTSNSEIFENITRFPHDSNQPTAIMGDDTTSLNIHGYGMINVIAQGHRLRIMAYYVPKLGATLISAKQHMKSKGCYFHAEAGKTTLAFPNFFIYPRIATEIDINLFPATTSSQTIDFDEELSQKAPILYNPNTPSTLYNKSPIKTLKVISQSIASYIPDANLQQPFTQSVQIQRIIPTAKIPSRATPGSIGYDVSSITHFSIAPGEIKSIPTGLRIKTPKTMYTRIAPRSSLSLKTHLH